MSDSTTTAASPATAQPKPGYATTEGWLAFLAMIVGALPSSGLLVNASPLIVQIVGVVVAGFAAWRYGAQRTALKQAHLASQSGADDAPVAPAARAAQSGRASLPVLACLSGLALVASFAIAACGSRVGQITLKAGQCVLDKGVLGTVLVDLASQDYARLVTDLEITVGGDIVTCALQAIATPPAASSRPTGGEVSPTVVRARELLARRGVQ